MIASVGCDEKQLHTAVAFELSRDPAKRKAQVAVDAKLVNLAQDLLAPVNGLERIISVGCGHFAAFVRAVLAGCQTTSPTLVDNENGTRIHVSKLRTDPVFARCMDEGWLWVVISEAVEAELSALPDYIQRALNASNTVASESS